MHSDETLLEVERLAYVYLSKAEIAVVLQLNPELFNDDQQIIQAFNTGRLKRKAEYNNSVIELSKQLSSPAMLIESKIAEQAALNDLGL